LSSPGRKSGASELFIRREYPEIATRLLFVGQWLTMKGSRYLVEACTRLHRKYPDVHLTCAGTLEARETVLAQFPAEVRNHVHVFPRVNTAEMLAIHREADLFVFPTLSEGFSLALIEAAASGLPIVTTPVGASPDILFDGHSVVFCPPSDADALVDCVAGLLDDRGFRELLGKNAQRAAQAYRAESVGRDYASCLNRLMDEEDPLELGIRMETVGIRRDR